MFDVSEFNGKTLEEIRLSDVYAKNTGIDLSQMHTIVLCDKDRYFVPLNRVGFGGCMDETKFMESLKVWRNEDIR